MAKFLVRITLHSNNDLEHPDYAAFHDDMKNAGFLRRIQNKKGIWFHLPPAEYRTEGEYTITQVKNTVRGIANRIDKNNGVIVSHVLKYSWAGLKPAKIKK